MKKAICILLTAALLLTMMIACAKSSQATEPATEAPGTEPPTFTTENPANGTFEMPDGFQMPNGEMPEMPSGEIPDSSSFGGMTPPNGEMGNPPEMPEGGFRMPNGEMPDGSSFGGSTAPSGN